MVEQQQKSADPKGNQKTAPAPESSLAPASADQMIADLETQLQDATQRALRAQAELENYRKRTQREILEERRYALVPLVRDLLPVIDNLQRAIEATQARSASEGTAGLVEGVKMVAAQVEAVLKQHHCLPIEATGQPFDPNQHQAIAQEPSDQYPAGTVTRTTQVGYKLHDRVVRPAQVFVSTGPAAS